MVSHNPTEEELKQLLHDAVWKELPNKKYRDEMLTTEDIRIENNNKNYINLLVKNNLLERFGRAGWVETEIGNNVVRWKIDGTEGINFDKVRMEVINK